MVYDHYDCKQKIHPGAGGAVTLSSTQEEESDTSALNPILEGQADGDVGGNLLTEPAEDIAASQEGKENTEDPLTL